MRRVVVVLLSVLLAGCAAPGVGSTSEPSCFTSFDASYEPATPPPDPAASARSCT